MNELKLTELISERDVHERVKALAEEISHEYKDKEIFAVCILRGASIFFADLIREIRSTVYIDFMSISSYGDGTESTGEVKLLKDLDESVNGKNVLIVEDIVDSGRTVKYLRELLYTRNPSSVKICTFIDKPSRRKTETVPDFVGFEVEDRFIVGYGLDFAGRYRNLPAIYAAEGYEDV